MKLTILGCSGSMSGPTGAASAYLLQAQGWLAGANDIRIVLSSRLGIVDDASSEAVYARASYLTGEEAAKEGREIENEDDLLAVLYAMLTWWQESLLIAVGIKARRR